MPLKIAFSKISVKSQTVLPLEVRERLRVSPADRLRYVLDEAGVRIDKDEVAEADPFTTFTEWATPEDDDAYADL